MIRHAHKQKDLIISRGGTTGPGVDADKIHPVLGFFDLRNVLSYKDMKFGGADRMGAIGYGIAHTMFPLASLHILDDPTFAFRLFYRTCPVSR